MRTGDGYGELLLAALDESDDEVLEIVERDDGFIMASRFGPDLYLMPYRKWPSRQRRALRLARERVLDVGAGAGRVALHLQEKGHDVVAIDASPGAVEVCHRRGVRDARVLKLEEADSSLGRFDTVVMYGTTSACSRAGRRAAACCGDSMESRPSGAASLARSSIRTPALRRSTSPTTSATASADG